MSDTNLNPALAQRLATSAHGYGAVIDGVLNMMTVTATANVAAHLALLATGNRLFASCEDPDCDCRVKALAHIAPNVRIVPVRVEVA